MSRVHFVSLYFLSAADVQLVPERSGTIATICHAAVTIYCKSVNQAQPSGMERKKGVRIIFHPGLNFRYHPLAKCNLAVTPRSHCELSLRTKCNKINQSKESEVIHSSLFTIHCHSGQSEGTFSFFLYLPYTFPIPAVYHLYVKRPKTQ